MCLPAIKRLVRVLTDKLHFAEPKYFSKISNIISILIILCPRLGAE